eukprot:724125-Amphidinium_carterae.2
MSASAGVQLSQQVPRKQGGRPKKHKTLQEILAEAELKVGNNSTASSSGDLDQTSLPVTVSGPIVAELKLVLPKLDCVNLNVRRPDTFVDKAVLGYTLPSSNEEALLRAVQIVQSKCAASEGDYSKLHKRFFDSRQPPKHVSASGMAEQLGINRQTMYSKLSNLANSERIVALYTRRLLEKAACMQFQAHERLVYLDCMLYDESPMRTTLRDIGAVEPLPQSSEGADFRDDALVMTGLGNLSKMKGIKTKILQMRECFVILLKTQKGFVHFRGVRTPPLMAMERGNAQVLQKCLNRASGVSNSASMFQRRLRLSITDKAAYNLKAEREIVQDRAGWVGLQQHCQIHSTSNTISRSIDCIFPADVKGILHCALSLKEAGSMSIFRTALRQEIAAKVVILHGAPSQAAKEWRESMLTIFTCNYSHSFLQQCLLNKLPNGDWRAPEVQYYVPTATQAVDKPAIVKMLVEGLCWLFTCRQFKLWPQHRWTGFDICCNQIGLLLACHNLLEGVYKRFAQGLASGKKGMHLVTSGHAADFDRSATMARTNHDGDDDDDDASARLNVLNAHVYTADWNDEVASAHDPDSAEQHSLDRKITLAWLETKPLANIIAMRICLEPLIALMRMQLEVAGDSWELKQRCIAAKQLMSNSSGLVMSIDREYNVSLAANHVHEEEHLAKVALIYQPTVWSCVPEDALTCAFRSQVFRSLSRQGCGIHQLVKLPNMQFPTKLFTLMHKPEMLSDMCSLPECVLGPWACNELQSLKEYSQEELLQRLQAYAGPWCTNISGIEARHASIRRGLYVKSTQVTTFQFAHSSAEFIAQHIRRGEGSVLSCRRGVPSVHKKTKAKVCKGKEETNNPCPNLDRVSWHCLCIQTCSNHMYPPTQGTLSQQLSTQKCPH